MAVVGIDFGTMHSKIGVARHRGIDIITNEVSNRATPSLVSFGPKQRALGEPAKTQEISNLKNTISSLKRIIGRSLNDPDFKTHELPFVPSSLSLVSTPSGEVGVEVLFRGEKKKFSATQLTAMYLSKLKATASIELKAPVTDIVLAIPGWFDDKQRRAMLDAAAISGLNVLRLINDQSAVALGYGITKSDLPEPPTPADDEVELPRGAGGRKVVFIDIGHSSTSVSVVSFLKGHSYVKSTAYDPHLGGRNLDLALVRHFAEEFKTRYKIDVLSNPKATFRLFAGCEKLKKVLSANSEGSLNVESIMSDVDVSSRLTREAFEGLITPVLERIPPVLERALAESGLEKGEIDAIELVGGTTRVPCMRKAIESVFEGKILSTTLNQDEAVARGSTFMCAMLSPVFKVREFTISDINYLPIKFSWDRSLAPPEETDSELEVFPRGQPFPSTKILSFHRTDAFEINIEYSNTGAWIGRFVAKHGGNPVKVRSRLNQHGIVSIESAYVEEEVISEVVDEDGATKKKKKINKKEISFVTGYNSIEKTKLEELRELENEMFESDKLVMDTEDRKNALEEYIYDTRSKLDDRYAPFTTSSEKSSLLSLLSTAEEWLYSEEGEDATKSAYVEKLDGLKQLGDKITFRWRESTERTKAAVSLRETLDSYLSSLTPTVADKYSHIAQTEIDKVLEKIAVTQKWLDDALVKQSERRKNEDVIVKSEEIMKARDEVIYFVAPILSKPKPKPPVGSTPGSGTQTPRKEGTETPRKEEDTKKDDGPSVEMDVD